LRIEVDQQGAQPSARQAVTERYRRGGLPHTAFLIGKGKNDHASTPLLQR
jgi:hypothetical protein